MLARQSHSKIHLLSQIKHLIWYIYVRHDGMTSSGRRPRWGEVRSPIRVGSILALEMLHFGAFSEFGPNFTGWRFLREASFLFVLAYFFTSAFMAARHHILLRLYIWRLTLNHAAVSDPDRHRHYSCRQRDEPLYRWPCLSGGRCTGLECIAFVCQNIVDVLCVSSRAKTLLFKASFEDQTVHWVQRLAERLMQAFSRPSPVTQTIFLIYQILPPGTKSVFHKRGHLF